MPRISGIDIPSNKPIWISLTYLYGIGRSNSRVILKELAARRQVICITHQAQIAGRADAHFFVYKEIVKNIVKTNIRQLAAEERITAIAKMLSGEKPTAAALENAREIMSN